MGLPRDGTEVSLEAEAPPALWVFIGIISGKLKYKNQEWKRGRDHCLPCDALAILKKNHENPKAGTITTYHKTLFVTDASKKIIGKLSMNDLTSGLVPEIAKKAKLFSARAISSRVLEVADEVGEFQAHFKWLHNSFLDLLKQEANKKVKDIMSPVHPVLREGDNMNHAIFVLFKDGVRQQLVIRDGEIVGVVNLMVALNELLETVGPECGVTW